MGRRANDRTEILLSGFGPLEVQVLEAIWRGGAAVKVSDLRAFFPGVAYTTLMTTADRLHKKGVLGRSKVGRAYAYRSHVDRSEIERRLAARSVEEFLGAAPERRSLEPLLSCFIDAVSERDRLLLDDLERLLQEKRQRLFGGGSR